MGDADALEGAESSWVAARGTGGGRDGPGRPAVAVIGAGFSGSLAALHLLNQGPHDLTILLIERGGGFGRGLAYGACEREHLLNVRAGNMSAFPDQPRHAVEWLSAHEGPVGASGFATREAYGRYLAALLLGEVRRPRGAGRLILVHDQAVSVRPERDGLLVEMAMGNRHAVTAAVLATGHMPPGPPAGDGWDGLPPGLYIGDPWAPEALAGLEATAPVLLLGTGLTMVDVTLSLQALDHRGAVTAISRRGLLPRTHDLAAPVQPEEVWPPSTKLSSMVRWVRARAAERGWRSAVDDLRPTSQSLWRAADLGTRRRFLRHLRPWWDVHRHRMAPQIAGKLAALRSVGRLVTVAGEIRRVDPDAGEAVVRWRPRGGHANSLTRVRRIINCTGPGAGPAQAASPLIRDLLDRGGARIDPLGLGLDVDEACRIL
ncbi:MAG: FAD/NAD(P)-binding protein, partial [Caulobacteraceae bacterium]|nr:FAD/NAD(P)-binding protein [Caulobacteraceae bacterium]